MYKKIFLSFFSGVAGHGGVEGWEVGNEKEVGEIKFCCSGLVSCTLTKSVQNTT